MLTFLSDDGIAPSITRAARQASGTRIALIGGFKPRKCGIATFTTDLFEQITRHYPSVRTDVYAMISDAGQAVDADAYGIILDDNPESYRAAALRMNEDAVDAVWLQHEYGIFGGECGELVLDLIDRVAAPLIVTLHTVLEHPSPKQEAIIRHIVHKASRLMVMSRHARDLLLKRYGAEGSLIDLIEHGAPDRPEGREAEMKRKLSIADRPVLMTFGLLGPGKGLETAIAALPAIVERHPDVLYRIVGATHPNLVAEQGESYRDSLHGLADRLGVTDNIEWDNRFLELDDLLDQLEACDIYLTPYLNMQQSTSGTLSYAVALGKAIVSTPYVHAQELLADDVGVLVEPGSSTSIASAVNALLDSPARLAATKARAYERGRSTIWSEFAGNALRMIRSVATVNPQPYRIGGIMPTPALTGLRMMSDDTGILQHGITVVPDRRHGYCLDDNARALMLMNRVDSLADTERLILSTRYASFVQHCWNPDQGLFRNFMSFERTWCEETGSEDSNGRGLWSLGHTAAHGCTAELRAWAKEWFDRTAGLALKLGSPRAIGFSMLGAAEVLSIDPDHALSRSICSHGGDILKQLLARSSRPDWTWFEAVLGYDNPRLPEALMRAAEALGREDWRDEALDALMFICNRQMSATGYFRPIGSDTFGKAYEHLPFDQQPLEAWAAIDACVVACTITGDSRWRDHAEAAYGWFHGYNDRGEALVDLHRGTCRDGITSRGVNLNCGAESLLAYQLSYYSMMDLARLGTDEGGTVAQDLSGSAAKPVAAA